MDFKDVKDYVGNTVSTLETPRMAWHDVSPVPIVVCMLPLTVNYQTHMTLVGPCVLDVVQHFVERWNEIKKRKVRRMFI